MITASGSLSRGFNIGSSRFGGEEETVLASLKLSASWYEFVLERIFIGLDISLIKNFYQA
jgi:hypothetical protein